MADAAHKVLIITYYFPPAGGAPVQRTLRFLHGLANSEWQPIILTVRNGDFANQDDSLLESLVEKPEIYRTYIPEPYKFYRLLTGKSAGQAVDLSTLAISESRDKTLAERISMAVRDWLFIPDPRVGWLPFAIAKGLSVIRKHHISLIYSTAPPNSVHLVAKVLKSFSGLPWVADFRDPWFKYLAPKRRAALPLRVDSALCRSVIRSADHIISVCNGVEKELSSSVPFDFKFKSTVLTNGYVAKRFERKEYHADHQNFTLCYVGSLYRTYDFSNLISAFERIYQNNAEFRTAFELIFVGSVDEAVEQKFRKAAFAGGIKFLGFRNHSETVDIMTSATVLLLYIIDSPQGRNIPTSKLYEYLGAGRPIFAIAPEDSDAGAILQKTRAGVISPDDVNALETSLLTLFQKWQEGGLAGRPGDQTEVQNFEISNLTKRLAAVWTQALNKK